MSERSFWKNDINRIVVEEFQVGCIDIAASGDTIYVRPGYYDDFQWLSLGNSVVYVISEEKDLTFIGEGPDQTIVGHQNGDASLYAIAYVNDTCTGDLLHVDLGGNYWGTTDSTYVAQWIKDGNDDPDLNYYIDFQPIADGPVPTEEKSFGSIKAMFR